MGMEEEERRSVKGVNMESENDLCDQSKDDLNCRNWTLWFNTIEMCECNETRKNTL